MLPLNALRAFEAAARNNSIKRAAEQLNVAQSAVSRHVSLLEDMIGVRLFDRQANKISLTAEGERLLNAVGQGFDGIDRVLEDLKGAASRDTLDIILPPSFAPRIIIPTLNRMKTDYPELTVNVDASLSGELPDDADFDVAVTYSTPRVTSLIMDLLWEERLTPLCHPSLLDGGDAVDVARFIGNNRLLHVRVGEYAQFSWPKWMAVAGVRDISAHSGITVDTAQLAVEYAMSGEGVVVTDPQLFQREIEDGKLCAPFDLVINSGYGYYLLSRPEDMERSPVRAFRDHLLDVVNEIMTPEKS